MARYVIAMMMSLASLAIVGCSIPPQSVGELARGRLPLLGHRNCSKAAACRPSPTK